MHVQAELERALEQPVEETFFRMARYREFDVAVHLMKNRHRLISRAELLKQVWRTSAALETRTVDTQAHVQLSAQGEGFVIDRISLRLTAVVPGLDEARFQEIAASAKRDCPLSKALASVAEISLVATLEQGSPP